ncbi:hypothetical protein D3C72_2266010 [compost metagenome]
MSELKARNLFAKYLKPVTQIGLQLFLGDADWQPVVFKFQVFIFTRTSYRVYPTVRDMIPVYDKNMAVMILVGEFFKKQVVANKF